VSREQLDERATLRRRYAGLQRRSLGTSRSLGIIGHGRSHYSQQLDEEPAEFRIAVHSTHSISCTAQLRGWYILLVTVARYNSPGGRGGQALPPSEVPVSVQPDALGSAA